MKDPKLYLIFAKERIAKLQAICENNAEAACDDDTKLLAIERLLETLADATQFFPKDKTEKFPDINWTLIKDFRNRLAHGYLGIDTMVIIDIINTEIPVLQRAVETMLEDCS